MGGKFDVQGRKSSNLAVKFESDIQKVSGRDPENPPRFSYDKAGSFLLFLAAAIAPQHNKSSPSFMFECLLDLLVHHALQSGGLLK
jgi:hypothetical protein